MNIFETCKKPLLEQNFSLIRSILGNFFMAKILPKSLGNFFLEKILPNAIKNCQNGKILPNLVTLIASKARYTSVGPP